MTDAERLKQWEFWLFVCQEAARDIITTRHVYDHVQAIIAANPDIHRESSFYDCYSIEHAVYSALAVRRCLDIDPRVMSLARLLDSVSKFPHVLSRERHVNALVAAGFD